MKVCPNCQSKYPDDANFCPQESCATPEGPCRLLIIDAGAQAGAGAAPPPDAGRFQTVARLGGNRSGEVWHASDAEAGGDVAYKLVAPQALPTPAALERAQRELKQLQRAQSPRIARVIDFGKTADGRFFVASELVGGQPLDRLVAQQGALPVDRVKKIAAQVGEALLEGQKVGVVHHDLSAKNVLVGANDDVKLINFVTPWPVTDTVFGVPEYISPEQAEGKLVDQRSNTYSLGALLMFMLTGEPPVSGPDPRAVIASVIRGDIAPPSRRKPGLPADIDRVVMKALEKSSSRRPLTMRQFLAEVNSMGASGGTGVGHHAPAPAPGAIAAAHAGAPGEGGQREVAFAKTMMFTGGSPEVQRLASQAAAARAEANGSGPVPAAAPEPLPYTPPPAPAASPFAMSATPPPLSAGDAIPVGSPAKRSHGAAVAATMMAMPAVNVGVGPMPGSLRSSPAAAALDPSMQPTPPPVMNAASAAGSGANSAGGDGKAEGKFRETLWFKKGDVDQMVAEAKAKVLAARGKPAGAEELPTDEHKPLEDRYVDDGSVTSEDRKKFSLGAGGAPAAAPAPMPAAAAVPGERMSESEMLNEIGGGNKKTIKIAVAAAVAVVVAIAAVLALRGGKSAEKAPTAAAPVEHKVAAPPPPEPPPAPPAAAAAAGAGEETAPAAKPAAPKAAAKPAAAKKHAAAKKRAAAAAAAKKKR